MKTSVYDITGKKKGEIELPKVFGTTIREDIAAKYVEASKYWQPYSPSPEAGKRHSASGIISHKRHDWKGQYGKGISRMPRKIMWRRGVQFNWVGAEVSAARGGRRAHGPEIEQAKKKINRKEMQLALNSGFASTADEKYILRRYSSLAKPVFKLPLVIESKLENIKAKLFFKLLKTLLGESFSVATKQSNVRAGRGKMRGRKYKSSAGLLLITGKDEKITLPGIVTKPVSLIAMRDLWPLGRLALYTEKSLEEMK